MSRAQRLLELLQILRRHKFPVSGGWLAAELGISLRTVYRDIATLQAQGAQIDGEPGVGYLLRPGFVLPPLMFSVEELEAIVLGSRWVANQSDERLTSAANNALAKIAAVLPPPLREELDTSGMLVGPVARRKAEGQRLAEIRQAIRGEQKLQVIYLDSKGKRTTRVIWPFALAFFEQARIVSAWCEKRNDYRHFRVDRIVRLSPCNQMYEVRRRTLLHAWRQRLGLPNS